MLDLLNGLRVVEAASFVAGPSSGVMLHQFGAEVIRIDPVDGGPDMHRWPVAPSGDSLYWQGLNKGKKSVALDLRHPEGRAIAQALVTAPGPQGGLFVTNHPADSAVFAHRLLAAARPDLITVRIMGWADGRPAVDYTVNSAVGIPDLTGQPDAGPVNHVLPAWDLLAGAHAAFTLLAAKHARDLTGKGRELRVPLGELALATVAQLGMVAEAAIGGEDRPRVGNALYGSFGRDFVTRDGRRVMVVALTPRHWNGLVDGLGVTEEIAAIEAGLGLSLADDEGARFIHRARLEAVLAPRIAALPYAEATALFDRVGVPWGPYRSVRDLLTEEPALDTQGWLFSTVTHPDGLRYPTPGPATHVPGEPRGRPGRAPRLGEHTAEVLNGLLSISPHEIGRLSSHGIVRCAPAPGNPETSSDDA